jgi:hypothetical protein
MMHNTIVVLAGVFALASCSKTGGTAPPDAGSEAGAPAGMTCQQIRMCVFGAPCADDACVQACAARGSPEAQAAFETLRACSAKMCTNYNDNYVNCLCGEQCLAGGSCLQEADACVGPAGNDDICDALCA